MPSYIISRQFTVVLNSIICFFVPFCDNSLLVPKMRFQVVSFVSKKVQGFSSDTKILMSLLSVLFHLQNHDIWGNVHYVPKVNLISKGTLMKSFYLPSKTNLKKSETRFCRRKLAEKIMPK